MTSLRASSSPSSCLLKRNMGKVSELTLILVISPLLLQKQEYRHILWLGGQILDAFVPVTEFDLLLHNLILRLQEFLYF